MRSAGMVLVAALLFAASAGVGIAARPLMPVDETRVLSVAWEMRVRRDYLVPHLNGLPYSHKPPALYWAIDAVWALAGVGETAARLVPPLLALAAIVGTAVLASLLWPGRDDLAGYAALALAGTASFALFGGVVLFDGPLAACVTLGLAGVVLAWRREDRRGWVLFGAALGLGILVKGPVALLHLLPVPVLAPVWQHERRAPSWTAWYVGAAAGTAIGAAIALAWALPAAAAGGEDYARAILWGQTAGRMVASFAHRQPGWFYVVLLPVLLFPWSLWPPVWRAARAEARQAPDDGQRMVLVWIAAVVVLMSLVSGKQPHYLVPLLPAFGLLVARLLDTAPAPLRAVDLLLPALLPVAVGMGLVLVPGSAVQAAQRMGAPPPPEWAAALDPAAGAALVVGTIALAVGTAHARATAVAGVAAMTVLVLCVAHVEWSRVAADRYDLRPVATALAAREHDGLAVVGGYNGEFGFLGRLTTPVAVIGPDEVEPWLAAHPRGRVVVRYHDASAAPAASMLVDRPYRGGRLAVLGAP
ncbi:MAG TPA: glycosyltransferase family 39 protein [Thermodesulfobacteriota bacterium]